MVENPLREIFAEYPLTYLLKIPMLTSCNSNPLEYLKFEHLYSCFLRDYLVLLSPVYAQYYNKPIAHLVPDLGEQHCLPPP